MEEVKKRMPAQDGPEVDRMVKAMKKGDGDEMKKMRKELEEATEKIKKLTLDVDGLKDKK